MKKTREEKQIKKNKINILIVTFLIITVFTAMSVYIVNYSISNRQVLISNSYNGRQKILAAKNIRGTIYSKDGDVLVSSSVNKEGNEVRNYAYGNMFSHVLGYAVNGRMGVEDAANYYLINSNAPISVKAKADAEGKKYPGDSVYTTLDLNLQKVAFDAMGIYQGAVIATEPETGKILCMVSKPDFDPASIVEKWDEYLNDSESGVLVNRVTQGKYPPGSTFKIITALEYIRENPENYNGYSYTCTGSLKRGDETIRCYHGTVHGQVDFKRSFAKSCNSSFANIGLSLDKEQFNKTLDDLLFNKNLPTDLVSTKSNLRIANDMADEDLIQVSIGQGQANISPLQLNMITSAIANNGVLMKPYVIDRIENSSNTVIKAFKPESYGKLLSEDEALIMQDLFRSVVEEGTASKLKDSPYYSGGKTGSAEFGTVKGESHAWFTGYAKDETGKTICVTVIIESAGSGGDYAVPIAKRIFDAYFGEY